jgi:hypothetical protein
VEPLIERLDRTITFFVANEDGARQPIDDEFWRTEAQKVMTRLFSRGTTAWSGPTARRGHGTWLEEGEDEVRFELTWTIDAYTTSEQLDLGLPDFVRFCCRYGREAKQLEVAFLVDHTWMYRLRDFSEDKEN